MAGSPGSSTTTTKTELSPEQRALLDLAMPSAVEFAASTPRRYPGATVAPMVQIGHRAARDAMVGADAQQRLAGGAENALTGIMGAAPGERGMNFISQDYWNPANNPNLRGAIDAATRPITEQLTESALPAIRGEAIKTGGFGGSRQGVAEGLASREASRAIGDTGAKLTSQLYDTNMRTAAGLYGNDLDATLKALGLTPNIQTSQVTPAATRGAVGEIKQAQNQAALNDRIANWNFDQNIGLVKARELASLLSGLPGGSTIATATGQPGRPGLTQAAGGAATGASFGSLFGPVGTVAGGGIGALLPFLV